MQTNNKFDTLPGEGEEDAAGKELKDQTGEENKEVSTKQWVEGAFKNPQPTSSASKTNNEGASHHKEVEKSKEAEADKEVPAESTNMEGKKEVVVVAKDSQQVH